MDMEFNGKEYLVGSRLFFDGMPDYNPKDSDYVMLVENPTIFNDCMTVRGDKKDIFLWRKTDAEEFVDMTIRLGTPMLAGKFLNKELCVDIRMTQQLFRRLKPLFDNMDDKHAYQKPVFDHILKTWDFDIPDKIKNIAFLIYLNSRN